MFGMGKRKRNDYESLSPRPRGFASSPGHDVGACTLVKPDECPGDLDPVRPRVPVGVVVDGKVK